MAEQMKVKEIVWDDLGSKDYYICLCGKSRIGSVEKESREFLARIFTGNYSYLKTESEARAWVELQFNNFIKEISA